MKTIPDMSFDDYCAADALNASTLKAFAVSGKQGVEYLTKSRTPSASMRLGTALHARMELGEEFDKQFVEIPKLRPGAVPATWAKAEETLESGQAPLAEGWRVTVEKMHDALMSHPVAGAVLRKPHENELSIFWDDPDLGVPCKARLDRWLSRTGCILDIKTTAADSPRGIEKKIDELGYHIQAAWYMRGARFALDTPRPEFLFTFVQTSAPHDVVVVDLDDDAIRQGWAAAYQAANRWKAWRDTGRADGLSDQPLTLGLPGYARIDNWHAPVSLLEEIA